jgi:hypothetical protein
MVDIQKKSEWLPFSGVVTKKDRLHTILKATDGSGAVIGVLDNDIKIIGKNIYLRLNCNIHNIKPPKTNSQLPTSFPC